MAANDKIRRSWLLVPMSSPERVSSAHQARADVVILDLVEFVAEPDKPAAREIVAENLNTVKAGGAEAFVQIDPELMLADLRAAIRPGISGVVVSRAESAEQIAQIDATITVAGGRAWPAPRQRRNGCLLGNRSRQPRRI